MFQKSLLAVCLSVSLLAGCGGGDGGDPKDLTGVCNATDGVFVGLIDRLFECNPIFELFLPRPTTTETAAGCTGALQPYIDDGTVTIDQTAVGACREWLTNATCATISQAPNPCDGIFVGTRAVGESCDDTAQCAGDNFCDVPNPGCGFCAARKADGQTCVDDEDCAGRYCDSNGSCGSQGGIGADCTADEYCDGEYVCGTNSQCEAAPTWAQGVPCGQNDLCGWPASGLYCDGQSAQCENISAVGELCSSVLACDVPMGLACDIFNTGRCIDSVEVAQGADCNPLLGTHCPTGLLCAADGMGGQTCQSPDIVGDACVDECSGLFMECVSDQCQLGSYTGMCPAP